MSSILSVQFLSVFTFNSADVASLFVYSMLVLGVAMEIFLLTGPHQIV